eukprot:2619824-Rhodomonas_salina.1
MCIRDSPSLSSLSPLFLSSLSLLSLSLLSLSSLSPLLSSLFSCLSLPLSSFSSPHLSPTPPWLVPCLRRGTHTADAHAAIYGDTTSLYAGTAAIYGGTAVAASLTVADGCRRLLTVADGC